MWGGGWPRGGGAVAEWVERWTGDRVVQGSNLAAATDSLRNFGNSIYPALPVSFGGDTKKRRSLLLSEETLKTVGPFYLVSMPG